MIAEPTWRWIRSGTGGPAFNMAMDEALLRGAASRPTFRTYLWTPWSLSLGYFQAVREADLAPFRKQGLGVVRRPTGGRAILHGDELTYSLAWPTRGTGLPRTAVAAYIRVHGALIRALARFGVEAGFRADRPLVSDTAPDREEFLCFYRSSEFDLVRDDRKLVGSAQRRSGESFLMHGSIPCGPNSVTPEAACTGVDPERLEEAFAEELGTALSVRFVPGKATLPENELARRLAKEKYGQESFTLRRAGGRCS